MAYLANDLAPNARAEERDLLIKALLLAPDQDVLEVGAWDGYLASRLAGHEISTTLVDRMSFGVERLRKQFPTMRVFEGLQERIPVLGDSFDRVASLVALHHVNAVAFIKEARRVLRAEGRVAIVEVGRGSRVAMFLDTYVDKMTQPRGHRGIYLSPGEWVAHLEAAGFEASAEYRTAHWRFRTMSQAIEYCRLVFGMSPTVTDADIQAAIELLDPVAGDDAAISWEWPLLVVTGDVD